MNCANHPDLPVAAYCQNCGKPLCAQCMRSVSGVVYCESCLAAKLGISGAAAAAPGSAGFVPGAIPIESGPNPGLALGLGFIPGVGAMYNGQFIKALIHVLVFVILIGITDEHPLFGIFIAAWVFYQVFDAYQTAKARLDGMPLPDPFGLNELSQRIGIPNRSYSMPPAGFAPPSAGSAQGQYQAPYQATYAVPPVPPPPPAYGEPYIPDPYAAVPPIPPLPPDLPGKRPEPVGAIVLIVVGMLFLFSTLGVFRFDWIGHGWPILVIVIGVWLLVRRTREVPPPPAPPAGGAQ
jgi:hypothetical protein